MKIDSFTLFLERFEVAAAIGIHESERQVRQRVLVDVTLRLDPARLDGGDAIAGTLDYDFLREDIADLVARRRFDLQETLAREIVALIARRPEVDAGTVRVCKPDIYPDARSVGCELGFSRK